MADRFHLVIEALCLLAQARVSARVNGVELGADPHDEALWRVLDVVEAVALLDARSERVPARWPFGHESLLHWHYTAIYDNEVEALVRSDEQLAVPAGHLVFCPRGCNSQWTTARHEQCGQCGSTMSAAFERAFHNSLVRGGQLI
jgi:hypothetical protein